MALLPIETAPKDKLILLYFPTFNVFSAQWWTGLWSYRENRWTIRTPFVNHDNKALMATELPEPMGWQEFPDVP